MGVSMSWLAVKDMEPEAIHKQLGLLSTREFDGDPAHPFVGRLLPSGWYLVVANRCNAPMILDDMLSSLSENTQVIATSVEEHFMHCYSTSWSGGKQEWRVQHEAEKGSTHLHVSGALPAEFEKIRQGAFARQMCHDDNASVNHVFEVPLELAKHFVGFRHDESAPGPELEFFEILKLDERDESPLKKARRKLW